MQLYLSGKHSHIPVLIDDDDYEMLSEYRWYMHTMGYAKATVRGKGIYMHRLVAQTPEGMHTDHLNHNKLDNRKENLVVCTALENMQNKLPMTTSGTRKPYKKYVRKAYRRGWVQRTVSAGNEYWLGIIKVKGVKYYTTTCNTEEMAQGALKQMIKDLSTLTDLDMS